ncbi:hypothetical protein Micbo1qcDRAFT_163468 [Microdochium bolleyi]|uniref:rRNA methyltransferase 1, mitochondrial n=1 Tax=Microdochium bolleyi TaxID=196109 RepID=A0A136J1D6_9PEZI|nr:hypothetical protein Micbo1qcDRAFT_163468 [Microdochium bolleyi]
MRVPTTSICLLARQNLLLRGRTSPSNVFSRSSSLSAIHRGLRDSQKARPQGFQMKALEAAGSGGRTRNQTTSRERRDPGWKAPEFRLRKGKKDITDKGPQPMSRRSRFNSPAESFGKKSQVWQIKHGNLRHEMDKLSQEDERASSRGRSYSDNGRDFGTARRGRTDFKDFKRSDEGRSAGRPPRPFERTSRDHPRTNEDRSFGPQSKYSDGGRTAARPFERNNTRTEFDERRPRTSSFTDRQDDKQPPNGRTEDVVRSDRDAEKVGRDPRREDGPIRIHHTTAASQFLYGRSVVEAALKHSRRQLYRFYVYSGEDRQTLSQDEALSRLAGSREIECITVKGQQGLRMLDKMSGGRPHNGCVLEASPLPQLPVKGLGVAAEEDDRQGFHLELAHQSAEEAQVNGSTAFVPYDLPAGRHPLVLLLDGILDPGNLGAILRSAAFLGVNAVAITKDSSAGLTPVALKASAGAAEVMTLFSVKSTLSFLEQSKEAGWMVYAAVPSTSRMRNNSHLTLDRVESYDPLSSRPTILVIGSEGEGLAKQVRRVSDHEVSIPSASGLFDAVDSLNASVATALLCQTFLKKQTNEILRSQGFAEREQDEEALF